MSHIGISCLQFDNNNKLYIIVNKTSIFRFNQKRNIMELVFNHNDNDLKLSSFSLETGLENKSNDTKINNTLWNLKINQFDFDKDNDLILQAIQITY